MSGAAIMLAGLVIDALLGWPERLFRAIGHPVTWIGALIRMLDEWLNLEGTGARDRRVAGLAAALLVIAVAAAGGILAQWLLPSGFVGLILMGLCAWPLIAARSLHDHVRAVSQPLGAGNLAEARRAVGRIVGRDPQKLDEPGIARAAIESLAENSSDGVIAPLFWGVIFGLPGLAAYKAINTLDSMIGHRTPRHEAFGWASAKIDDLANLIPARLTGLLFALASTRRAEAIGCMLRDARRHRSPNAGWPEAAMAGALGFRLSGPRAYADRIADEPWVNGGAADPTAGDIGRALNLYRRSLVTTAAGLALLAALSAIL